MIVCVTDHCNLASANKCTFVKQREEKEQEVFVESHELRTVFDSISGNVEWLKVNG